MPDDRRARSRRRLRAVGLAPGDRRHGTLNGYDNYGCRCEHCSRAKSRYDAGAHRRRTGISLNRPIMINGRHAGEVGDVLGDGEWEDPTFDAVCELLGA